MTFDPLKKWEELILSVVIATTLIKLEWNDPQIQSRRRSESNR